MWYIDEFLNDKKRDVSSPFEQQNQSREPRYLAMFATHIDAITTLQFIEKSGKLLLLSASTDGAVAIHSLNSLIGVFGQNEHWNINDIAPLNLKAWIESREASLKMESVNVESTVEEDKPQEDFLPPNSEIQVSIEVPMPSVSTEEKKPQINNEEFWSQQEIRKSVEEMNDVKSNKNNSTRTRLATDTKRNCSYRALNTKQMEQIEELEKPEFVLHPERYFLEREDESNLDSFRIVESVVDQSGEELKLKHDEKSIFPKYILDMEMKMRTTHKLLTTKQQHKSSLSHATRNKGARRPTFLVRQSNLDGSIIGD